MEELTEQQISNWIKSNPTTAGMIKTNFKQSDEITRIIGTAIINHIGNLIKQKTV